MDIGEVLRVISEPTRLRVIELLLERHHCARSLALTLGISEAAVSQHIAQLKACGVVTARRHGRHLHFFLNRDVFEGLSAAAADALERMDAIVDCHAFNPCQFALSDGTQGCLYQDGRLASQSGVDGAGQEESGRTGDKMRLAIPSETADGLASMRSGHFGHAPYFTIVTIEGGRITAVDSVKNVDHDQFGCGGVIDFALSLGIDAMVTIGMGRPPLTRFTNAGVLVYSERMTPVVGAVAEKFIRGECQLMSIDDACEHH